MHRKDPQSVQLIGVDLGGTAIKLARFSEDGELLVEHQIPTPQPAVPGAVCMAICEAIEHVDPDHLATRVGIALPGPCLLYTSPSPRDATLSRMPSSA